MGPQAVCLFVCLQSNKMIVRGKGRKEDAERERDKGKREKERNIASCKLFRFRIKNVVGLK